jgi:hypothetical protein
LWKMKKIELSRFFESGEIIHIQVGKTTRLNKMLESVLSKLNGNFLASILISLDCWKDNGLFQIQVHRRATEITEGYFLVIQS